MSVQTQIDRIISNISNAYNSVRDKGGTIPTTQDTEHLASAITSIPSGTDTSDADATANDILLNKTAYVKGSKITGNIQSKSSTNLTVSGATVTAPAGYYPSNASKSVSTMTLPTSTSTSHTGTSKYTIGRSTSTRYLNIPAGYNSSAGYYTISSVPNGAQGTPTATKGSVSNHSISVTPRCTDTTGYISGTTKEGTAVTVSASELVSGSETKTENGTYDVTNLAQVVVNVSGGGEIYDGTVEDYSPTETWVINETITFSSNKDYEIAFNSNNNEYSVIKLRPEEMFGFTMRALMYDFTPVYDDNKPSDPGWYDQAYRTIVLSEPATGDLLTWLQADAVKQ